MQDTRGCRLKYRTWEGGTCTITGRHDSGSDDDRRVIVGWIDLGCPIDFDFDPTLPAARGRGWLQDDNRPTLTVTAPHSGTNGVVNRILIGMHDYDSGLDLETLQVTADFELDGIEAGANLAAKFNAQGDGVWEWRLAEPITSLARSKLTFAVKDRQGNTARIERTFSVAASVR